MASASIVATSAVPTTCACVAAGSVAPSTIDTSAAPAPSTEKGSSAFIGRRRKKLCR